MPVDEGQEPKVPNEGQPIVEGRDEELTAFSAYDPTEYRPRIETGDDDDKQAQAPDRLYDDEGKPLPEFDPRYAEDFEGLVFLGALLHSFEWVGHRFVIRTLSSSDLLAVPMVIKPWEGTIGHPKAYAIAMAALAVVSVDGQELPIPVGDGQGEYSWAFQRFNYVKANWFQFTIDKVYSEYMALEAKAQAVIEAMEKASGPAASTGGLNAASAGPNDRAY